MEWFGDGLAESIRAAGLKELPRQAERLLTAAKKEAPVDTGDLMRSGTVTMSIAGQGGQAEVSFNTPYAVVQHENMGFAHPHGKAKYLEDPLRAMSPSIFEAIRKAQEAALVKGLRR
jgi:hypothetical protein